MKIVFGARDRVLDIDDFNFDFVGQDVYSIFVLLFSLRKVRMILPY